MVSLFNYSSKLALTNCRKSSFDDGRRATKPRSISDSVCSKKQKHPSRTVFSLSQVSEHCESHDCWVIIADKVYDVTKFLSKHPGGRDIILEYAGRDATVAYRGVGHEEMEEFLETFCIGHLIKSDRMNLRWENDSKAETHTNENFCPS